MKLEEDGVHPDEGMIHAWLDGALDAEESARLEAHVAGCTACASRVAEARGLIAGASRVVRQLDEQPVPLIKPASTPTVGTDLSVWRLLRVTPARAAIAAVLVVAVGIGLTRGHLGVDSRRVVQDTIVPAGIAPVRDSMLRSAIERRLASEQPPRTVAAAPGVAIPSAPAEGASAPATNFGNAEAKVLAGRASILAQRDSAAIRADRTSAGVGQLTTGAADARERVAVAAHAADSAGRTALTGRMKGAPSVAPGECYRVESASPATWGSVRLPMIVAVDSTGTLARVLTTSGAETQTRAFLQYNGADSAIFRLGRIGFSGSMTLAAEGTPRAGAIRSTASKLLSEVAINSAGTSSEAQKAAPPTPAPAGARGELGGAAAISVTARRVSCPTP